MKFSRSAALLAGCLWAGAAAASPFQDQIVGCLSSMQSDADWAACRAAMFTPCPTEEVGSEAHVACLRAQVDDWEAYLQTRHTRLTERLPADRIIELTMLVGQWRGYVKNQCALVAARNPEAGEAAELGCRISETAGLATEMASCEAGFSQEPYCTLKEE